MDMTQRGTKMLLCTQIANHQITIQIFMYIIVYYEILLLNFTPTSQSLL